ncbi:lactonase family protein [Actinacidiphila oryziradicis]|uniref:Lactonase family protein n=1 Tax=Actinacidiphila oryziradicis TaxID=2571141 RepID=A0A4V6WJ84_9ACTN|nr:lactonase family protein [Actinacidiphila oryziradicis]TKA08469.1 lactonase family protein [Actinacidiphila oryziradicis]
MSSKHKSRTKRHFTLAGAGILAAVAAVATVTVASASQEKPGQERLSQERLSQAEPRMAQAGNAVFVQGNELGGNTVHAFKRAADGALAEAGTYSTGGLGGSQINAPTDSLASQGSLVHDRRSGLLLAVNAGSNTVTAFHAAGVKLTARQVIASGGDFPSSITVSGKLAYVLDAGGTGTIQGYRITKDGLTPLTGSSRSLGLANKAVPLFSSSPGQIAFTPDGHDLVVTTKSANIVEVFPLANDGTPATAKPVSTPSAGAVPFAITFDRRDHLLIGEAGKSTVTTYQVRRDGSLKVLQAPLTNGQQVLCWLERAGKFFYGGNTGNSTVSGYVQDKHGKLALSNEAGIAAAPSPQSQGVIDLAVTPDAKFLYVQNATSGTIDGFRVGRTGALTKVATTTGLPAFGKSGMEGIVAD